MISQTLIRSLLKVHLYVNLKFWKEAKVVDIFNRFSSRPNMPIANDFFVIVGVVI